MSKTEDTRQQHIIGVTIPEQSKKDEVTREEEKSIQQKEEVICRNDKLRQVQEGKRERECERANGKEVKHSK